MNYGRHYNDEDMDMYYRMQLTIDQIEYILGYEYIDAKTIVYEIPIGIYELTQLMYPKDLEVKADEKYMKTFLTRKCVIIFNSDLNEVLGFTNKRHKPGTHLSDGIANKTNFDKAFV